MHGVLRQSQPVFDAEAQTLTLKFKYQLHRKKIEDSKPKKAIAAVMQRLFGGAPTILTEVDVQAEPPKSTSTTSTPAADDATSSVIAMMGGGEVVNA